MPLEKLVAALQARKGDGSWHLIAKTSAVHYDTVARIARGAIANPGAKTVDRLAKAIAQLPKKQRVA